MLVRTKEQLAEVCAGLRAAGSFGFDTEFVQERNYVPRLGIVQVAAPGIEAIFDPGAIGTLDPFHELLVDPAVEKVVHSGQGDFGIFYWRTGKAPTNVFDVQVAAALVGYGERLGFGRLVELVTGKRLAKSETLTDWTRRPLTPEQIEYALDDVRPLAALRAHLGEKLRALGREEWAREELRTLEDPASYERPDPHDLWQRIRAPGLDGRALAILRELAAWREEEAMARDVPRGMLAKDDVLVELARHPPTKQGALRGIRFLDSRTADRCGADIVAATKRGLEAPPVEVTAFVKDDSPALAGVVALLDALLRARAQDAQVAPGVIATRAQLESLAAARGTAPPADLPVLAGWRRTLAGNDLLALLEGRLRLSLDPATGAVRVEEAG